MLLFLTPAAERLAGRMPEDPGYIDIIIMMMMMMMMMISRKSSAISYTYHRT